MFENQQRDDVEKFINTDADIRRLFYRHKELNSKLRDADIGVLAIDDTSLAGLKKEKLRAKDKLEKMWAHWEQSRH
jgi:uncharacterized protein